MSLHVHSAKSVAAPLRSRAPLRPEPGHWARYANVGLGFWLFVSAFVWPHTPITRLNTFLVGLFVLIASSLATGVSVMRQLTSVLALWLLLTTILVYPASTMTLWNNVVVACLALILSLIPSADERHGRASR